MLSFLTGKLSTDVLCIIMVINVIIIMQMCTLWYSKKAQ